MTPPGAYSQAHSSGSQRVSLSGTAAFPHKQKQTSLTELGTTPVGIPREDAADSCGHALKQGQDREGWRQQREAEIRCASLPGVLLTGNASARLECQTFAVGWTASIETFPKLHGSPPGITSRTRHDGKAVASGQRACPPSQQVPSKRNSGDGFFFRI